MNDLNVIEVLTSDISAAAHGCLDRYPGVMHPEQLKCDIALRILDEGLGRDLLDHEYPGERIWWIQGIGYRIIREHLAEFEQHREANDAR